MSMLQSSTRLPDWRKSDSSISWLFALTSSPVSADPQHHTRQHVGTKAQLLQLLLSHLWTDFFFLDVREERVLWGCGKPLKSTKRWQEITGATATRRHSCIAIFSCTKWNHWHNMLKADMFFAHWVRCAFVLSTADQILSLRRHSLHLC